MLFDTFEGLEVLIITEEMANVFDTTCPDYVVPGENNVIGAAGAGPRMLPFATSGGR